MGSVFCSANKTPKACRAQSGCHWGDPVGRELPMDGDLLPLDRGAFTCFRVGGR